MSARLDGELTEDEARELDAHLKTCASCRKLMAELTELENGLESLDAEAPETLAPGVMRAIRAEKKQAQRRRKPHITAWFIAGAAALALLLGAAGVIDLPGFGAEHGHAAAAIGHTFADTQKSGEASGEAIAQERGCTVLEVRGCDGGIDALNGLEYETLSGGAKLYEVPADVMSAVLDTWQTVYPMQVYAPQEASDRADGAAYILLLPQ